MDAYKWLWEIINENSNINIIKSFVKARKIINDPRYDSIICSISGGSDSDIMLDLISRIDYDNKVRYVWFDTGLEYQATKDHLKYLEQKYDIEIIRERAIKPIPLTCKQYGQPFLSKYVSQQIERLQKHGFKWEDKPMEELMEEYPRATSAVKWWCNGWEVTSSGYSKFNINYNSYLKEFMLENPPEFKIGSQCCKYAKKDVAKHLIKKYDADLNLVGVRKAEGGIRGSLNTCYNIKKEGTDDFRPIFWYTDFNKYEYEKQLGVIHSDCYTKYGFKRTGCCCCPYGRKLEQELEATKKYEPQLYKAVCNVFKDSYAYTRKYREFVNQKKLEESIVKGQMTLEEIMEE